MLIASDIHFGANRDEDIARFLVAAAEEANAQGVVVLPGDFTQSASEREYELAAAFLSSLRAQGNRIVITPGNHDYGVMAGERLPGFGTKPRARFRRLLDSVLEQREVLECRDTDTLTVAEDDAFLSLRSTHRGLKRTLGLTGVGRIRKKQVRWAREILIRHREVLASRRLHFVTHRSLWRDQGSELAGRDKHLAMKRRRRLEADILTAGCFVSFIHGHNHRGIVERRTTPKLRLEVWRIGAPTLSERNLEQRAGPSPLAPVVDHVRGYVEWNPATGRHPKIRAIKTGPDKS